MRTAPVFLILLVVINLNAFAKDVSDWAEVEKLKSGTAVRIVDRSGNTVEGYVTSVSAIELKLDALVTDQPGLLSPNAIPRSEIREVYKLGHKFERQLSKKNLILASAVGLIGGIAIGAAVDQAHPSTEDPGQAKLVGGVLGFFGGPAALALGRAVASGLHRTRLIYQASPDQTSEFLLPGSALSRSQNHLESSIHMLPLDSPYS